jgi:hypothetical protein
VRKFGRAWNQFNAPWNSALAALSDCNLGTMRHGMYQQNRNVRSNPKLAIFVGMIGNMKDGYTSDERGNGVEHISGKFFE